MLDEWGGPIGRHVGGYDGKLPDNVRTMHDLGGDRSKSSDKREIFKTRLAEFIGCS